jgi:hypothetical protein
MLEHTEKVCSKTNNNNNNNNLIGIYERASLTAKEPIIKPTQRHKQSQCKYTKTKQ